METQIKGQFDSVNCPDGKTISVLVRVTDGPEDVVGRLAEVVLTVGDLEVINRAAAQVARAKKGDR